MGTFFDDASLAFLPSGAAGKDGKAYSIKPTDGTGDFTFSRGSNLSATRIGPDGLIEKGRENLYTESNNFSDSDWSPKAGVFTKGVSDPNGGNDAWSWKAQNTDPFLYQSKNFTGVHCLSIYVKGVGSTIGEDFQIRVGTNIKDITLTGDWQRVQHFGVLSGSVNIGFEYGNPATANDVVHIYAAQLETGLVATEPIESGASTGKAGLLEDEPRFDYSGGASCPSLLLEPQRGNVFANSENLLIGVNYKSVGATITLNDAISPDGLKNASKFAGNTSAVFDTYTGYFQSTTNTFSVFAKAGTCDIIRMQHSATGGSALIDINLTSGAITSTSGAQYLNSSIENYGNGWYRISLIFTSGTGSYISRLSLLETGYVYTYGWQIEHNSSYPTSYIPTYGSAVTRSKDNVANLTNLQTNSLLGNNKGTLFIDFKDLFFEIAGTTLGSIMLRFSNTKLIEFVPNTNTTFRISLNDAVVTPVFSGENKIAISYDTNGLVIYRNGVSVYSTSSSTYSVAYTDLVLTESVRPNNININNIQLYNTRLTNAELATLTTL